MNTYTVTVNNYNPHIDGPETVAVQGLAADRSEDALTIYADAERTKVAAVFLRWEHVTIERLAEGCARPCCKPARHSSM